MQWYMPQGISLKFLADWFGWEMFRSRYVDDWLVGGVITLALCILLMGLRQFLVTVLKRRVKSWVARGEVRHSILLDVMKSVRVWFLLVVSAAVAIEVVRLPWAIERATSHVLVGLSFLQLALTLTALLTAWGEAHKVRKMVDDPSSVNTMMAIVLVGRVFVWLVVVLLALNSYGVNVTALTAGLGIGGIAIGLATQRILGDWFSSLSIMMDKPFGIGDNITTGEFSGTVENVGLKTTRIRSGTGEMIVISNSDLLASRIRNFRQMKERQALFSLHVEYGLPLEKLEAIPEIVRKIVEGEPLAHFERCHFRSYGTYSLVFEVMFFVKQPEMTIFLDTLQAVNLGIYKEFQKAGITLTYPTQIVKMAPNEKERSEA